MRHLAARGLLLALILATAAGAAMAESYPDRPIKLVVPFIAGSPVDALARAVARDVALRLGQPIVIENQAGAGGTLGSRAVANAAPDGHSILFAISSHIYGLYTDPGYDPIRSFVPVATVAQWSHVLVVRPDLPVATLQDLVAYARANPGSVTFGYGTNTPPQLLGETLKIATRTDIRSIPYRGGAQAVADVLGGRIDMNFGTTATLLSLIRDGRLRALAFTGVRRSPDLPDVPTVGEAGLPQLAFDPDAWAAILAPAGTAPGIIARLNDAVNASLASHVLRATLARLGYEPKLLSPAATLAFLRSEMERWPPIVRAAGLRAE